MPRRPLSTLTAVVATAAGLALVAPAAAAAAARNRPAGSVVSAVQDSTARTLTISGWAYDAAHPSVAVTVSIYVDGRLVAKPRTNLASPRLNQQRKLTGKHGYSVRLARKTTARNVVLYTLGAPATAGRMTPQVVDTARVTQQTTGARIVAAAKRFVGKARYRDGGATPRSGFDCSGYTQYVYALAKAGRLPHNAAGQKRVRGMKAVSAKAARPGDLVFYHGGGGIFHVAIYAGHHRQYAAATPRDGIVYQEIWSSSVSYGHLVP